MVAVVPELGTNDRLLSRVEWLKKHYVTRGAKEKLPSCQLEVGGTGQQCGSADVFRVRLDDGSEVWVCGWHRQIHSLKTL